jgi:hypothetical protein
MIILPIVAVGIPQKFDARARATGARFWGVGMVNRLVHREGTMRSDESFSLVPRPPKHSWRVRAADPVYT